MNRARASFCAMEGRSDARRESAVAEHPSLKAGLWG
jgi:hypothetical protein